MLVSRYYLDYILFYKDATRDKQAKMKKLSKSLDKEKSRKYL